MIVLSDYIVELYKADTFANPLFELDGCRNAQWSHANDLIVGCASMATRVYNVERGAQIAELKLDWDPNSACFGLYDDIILSDTVLWDYRIRNQIVHRFDRLSTHGVSVFHPSGNEVIINSEIWDVRTFRLLSTCPALDRTSSIQFSQNNDIIYAIYNPDSDKSYLFRTIDSHTMQTIASIDLEKTDSTILDLAVDPKGNYVACVVKDQLAQTFKLFEIGRARKGEEEEEEEAEEEEEEEEESEEFLHFEDDSDFDEDFDVYDDFDVDFGIDNEMLEALLGQVDEEFDDEEFMSDEE
jgi:HIV-1 Vpr-binding protein